MGFSSPFARIVGGCLTLALALFFLVRENSLLQDGLNLQLAVDPSVAWVGVMLLGLLGLLMLADGFFRVFNEQ